VAEDTQKGALAKRPQVVNVGCRAYVITAHVSRISVLHESNKTNTMKT
jgi:hypothetical protein